MASRVQTLKMLLAAGLAVLIVAGPPALAVSKTDDSRTAKASDVPPVPDDNACGVNTLFILLRSWGYDISPGDVRRTITPGYYGSSMRELKDAAKALGVAVNVFRCEVEDLGRDCILPAIAYMKPTARPGRSSRPYLGHFVLVFKVEPGPKGRVHWYDGTYGFSYYRPKSDFRDWWTGYVLSRPREDGGDRLALWATVAHAFFWPVVALWWFRGRRSGSTNSVCDREVMCHVDEPNVVGQGG
jgi:hypothetical protein